MRMHSAMLALLAGFLAFGAMAQEADHDIHQELRALLQQIQEAINSALLCGSQHFQGVCWPASSTDTFEACSSNASSAGSIGTASVRIFAPGLPGNKSVVRIRR